MAFFFLRGICVTKNPEFASAPPGDCEEGEFPNKTKTPPPCLWQALASAQKTKKKKKKNWTIRKTPNLPHTGACPLPLPVPELEMRNLKRDD